VAPVVESDPPDLGLWPDGAARASGHELEELVAGHEAGALCVGLADRPGGLPVDALDLEHPDRMAAIAAAHPDMGLLPAPEGQANRAIDQPRMEALLEEEHRCNPARRLGACQG